jgi:hypothetical protein
MSPETDEPLAQFTVGEMFDEIARRSDSVLLVYSIHRTLDNWPLDVLRRGTNCEIVGMAEFAKACAIEELMSGRNPTTKEETD